MASQLYRKQRFNFIGLRESDISYSHDDRTNDRNIRSCTKVVVCFTNPKLETEGLEISMLIKKIIYTVGFYEI
jgi:hypothetical protein